MWETSHPLSFAVAGYAIAASIMPNLVLIAAADGSGVGAGRHRAPGGPEGARRPGPGAWPADRAAARRRADDAGPSCGRRTAIHMISMPRPRLARTDRGDVPGSV